MEILKIENYKEYIGKTIDEWNIIDCADMPGNYVIVLEKNGKNKFFYIRKNVILSNVLKIDEDVYELWYKDFEDSKLLNLSEILNINTVISKMNELLQKYIQYE